MALDKWTDERVATLEQMWADGYSATRIGLELGVTRNAIIGKVHRLQLREPNHKLPVIKDRVYTRQHPDITREKRNAYYRNYQRKKRREKLAATGAKPTSAYFRKRLPPSPEMTKGELRAMLAQAMQNTAAL